VYQTGLFSAEWGRLDLSGGAALVSADNGRVAVPAAAGLAELVSASSTDGDGRREIVTEHWTLSLAPAGPCGATGAGGLSRDGPADPGGRTQESTASCRHCNVDARPCDGEAAAPDHPPGRAVDMTNDAVNVTAEAAAPPRAQTVRRVISGALITLLCSVPFVADAAAQLVNFRHFTSADGMPQAQVLALTQDRHGYIWFATYAGLSRFDGTRFRTYEQRHGLNANAVRDVVEDADGRLLVATSRGVCIMEGERFTCTGVAEGLNNGNALAVAPDGYGGLWVGTTRGVSRVNAGRVRNYTMADGLPGERINRVVRDSTGRVWAATDAGLARLQEGRFVLDSPAGGSHAVQFLTTAGAGVLVGIAGRLYRWDGTTATQVAPDAIPANTSFIDGAIDGDGTVWVATRRGVLRIRGDEVVTLTRTNGLLSDHITRVMVDREGVVWFGTDGGASKHVPGPFRTYTESEGLPSPFVRAIMADRTGRLWIGSRTGIAVMEGERFRAVPLRGVSENRVFGLAQDTAGSILVGTRDGLVVYSEDRVRHYGIADGLPSRVVYSFENDGHGGLWIGTERGLARWKDGRLEAYKHDDLANVSAISMIRDGRGRLWLGRVEGGVAILDGDQVTLLGASEGVTGHTVWALDEDASGAVWAATNGDGAIRFSADSIRHYTVDDGLASNFVWQVQVDRRGHVWLFGNQGLNRIAGDSIVHYGRGSGLIELEGAATASFEDANGTLWFGTGAGLVRYTPAATRSGLLSLPIYIEDATIDEQSFPPAENEYVRLRRGVVRIRFSSPSFRDESATRFSYRLVGADDWSRPAAEHSITYAGLAPGRYRFEVVAENRGVRSEAPAVLQFHILPAWWQAWWLQAAVVLLLVGAVATVPAVRARKLQRERLRLEALVLHHTRDLADKNARLEASNRELEYFAYIASHDLQEPLRKIRAFSDRIAKHYAERLDEQGQDYLSRMGSAAARMQGLIDALLGLSRVTTSRKPMQQVKLNALLDEVLGDLEVRIHATGGTVEVDTLPDISGDPVQIRQLFQNLIGNALKFHRPGTPPHVTVTAEPVGAETLRIRVADNGVGFDTKDAERVFLPFQRLHGRSEYEGTGIGLTICQKIVDRHGGTIRADSEPGRGTQFSFTLPLHNEGERHAA
jgi:ligand-binding sensor domain-containing protein/signal transduction histidine kinase